MKQGRPTTYTEEKADKMCELIAEGMSAVQACKSQGVALRSFYAWARDNPEFAAQLTRAREDQADTFADQMCEIADGEPDVQRAKLKIDARKWIAARMKPKSWGERTSHELTGANGGPIMTRAEELTDDQLAAIAVSGSTAAAKKAKSKKQPG